MCLSPENAQLKLLDDVFYHSFFSVACHGDRKVITFHVIPSNEILEHDISHTIGKCNTLQDLIVNLNDVAPLINQKIHYLISPCL